MEDYGRERSTGIVGKASRRIHYLKTAFPEDSVMNEDDPRDEDCVDEEVRACNEAGGGRE